MSDFEPLSMLIPKALSNYKLTRQARAALICQHFRELSPSIIGDDSKNEIRPKYFKFGTLFISVPNSAWAQRVYVHRRDLIMKLNIHMDSEYVKEIRTYVEAVGHEDLF